jgi:hypothetical protein
MIHAVHQEEMGRETERGQIFHDPPKVYGSDVRVILREALSVIIPPGHDDGNDDRFVRCLPEELGVLPVVPELITTS